MLMEEMNKIEAPWSDADTAMVQAGVVTVGVAILIIAGVSLGC